MASLGHRPQWWVDDFWLWGSKLHLAGLKYFCENISHDIEIIGSEFGSQWLLLKFHSDDWVLAVQIDNLLLIIPLRFNRVERGYTGFTLSVYPSVDRIVSALYLKQYSSDPFHICTSYQATLEGVSRIMFVSKFMNLNFCEFFKFVTLTLSSFDLGSDMT